MQSNGTRSGRRSFAAFVANEWITVLFVVVAIMFAVGATGFSGMGVLFPMAVGILTAALGIAEIVLQLARGSAAAVSETETSNTGTGASARSELLVWSWFVLSVGLIYLLGVIASSALSAFVYAIAIQRSGLMRSALAGLLLAASLWLIFAKLAGFQLYTGILL